jgi:hypothetical protein
MVDVVAQVLLAVVAASLAVAKYCFARSDDIAEPGIRD